MKIKDAVSLATAWTLLIPFVFFCGILMSPFWLAVAVVAGLLQAVEWKKVPSLWGDLVVLRWFWDGEGR